MAILKTKGKTTTRRRRRGDMIKETLRFLSAFFGDPEPKTVLVGVLFWLVASIGTVVFSAQVPLI